MAPSFLMDPAIFREYDIRGVVGTQFDEGFARALGGAYAAYTAGTDVNPVVVGRDCRLTSPSLAGAVMEGLVAAGQTVVDIGIVPTPGFYFACQHWQLPGGIMLTGSHNPSDYNGFKIQVGPSTIYGEEIQALRPLIEKGDFPRGTGCIEERDILPEYRQYFRDTIHLARPLTIIVDAGNGTAGPIAPGVLRDLGCTVTELYCDMDGHFPNHHPDPTVEDNMRDLSRAVLTKKADVGIGFDGDADRIGVVDETGRILWGDDLLVLYAREILARKPGATIVSEVKCSQRLFDDIEKHGGRAIMWKAGHSLLKAKMRKEHAELGGEMSGHMFFSDRFFGYDDAIYAACRLAEILAATDQPLSALLADLPPVVSTPEIRVDCPDDVKFAVVKEATQYFRERYNTITVDGVRILMEGGWGLIRASNTQPVLVLRFEADTEERLASIRATVEDALAAIRQKLDA